VASKRLVYVHIPKTGGTGLDTWLNKTFSERGVFWYPSDYILPRRVDVPECASVVVGHAPGDLDGTCITVMRDPAERVASLYYAHLAYGDFPHKGLSLHEFVEQAPYAEIDNGMTRRLAGGELDFDKALATLRRYAFVGARPHELVRWVETHFGPSTAVYRAMNINAMRPSLRADEREHILAHNQLDQELFRSAGNV
jgi:hypothetical protein